MFLSLVARSGWADTTSELLELTGGRQVRVAWVRTPSDAPPKQWSQLSYNGGVLMGFDTDEGKERVLAELPEKCENPYLTADGKRVVFSGLDRTIWVVDWNGGNLRKVMEGRYCHVMGVWQDSSGVDWVFAGDRGSPQANEGDPKTGSSIIKFRLDDPSMSQVVWDKTRTSARGHIGPDGKTLAAELPHPNMGLATLPNGDWTLYGEGCNPNIAPDGSGRFFFMLGGHKHIRLFGPEGPEGGDTRIAVNTMEDDIRDDAWRPRWTNDVNFISIQSGDYGPRANVFIGKFDEEFTWIEQWVRVTNSGEYDGDPVVWIAPEKVDQ